MFIRFEAPIIRPRRATQGASRMTATPLHDSTLPRAFRRVARFVYLAAAFAGLGGLLFGYDTGVISGAELFFKNDFALSTFALEVIVSGVLAGAAVGALVGGRLADLFGRRRLLIVTARYFRRRRRSSARRRLRPPC